MPKTTAKKTTTKKSSTKKATRKRTTKRATTAAASAPSTRGGGALRVRQVKSGIGHAKTYRRTLRALGLKHHQDEIVVQDNPSMRGMLEKVSHLVRVTPVENA